MMVKECACNEGYACIKRISVLVHLLLRLAPWLNGVVNGRSDLFLCESYFEYLVAEGACGEAEKYTIY